MPNTLYFLFAALGLMVPAHAQQPISGFVVLLPFVLLLFFFRYHLARGLIVFCAGVLISCIQLATLIESQLAPELQSKDVIVTLKVVGLPEVKTDRTRFEGAVEMLYLSPDDDCVSCAKMAGQKIRLSWRDPPTLKPGQRWTLLVRLKRPRGFVNPGGFDYQAWLLGRRISATGYVKSIDQHRLIAQEKPSLIDGLRYRLNQSLFQVSSLPHLGVLKALILGERSDIQQQHWDIFSATGTSHLIAISGLHIGLIAWFSFAIGKSVTRIIKTNQCLVLRGIPVLLSILSSGFYAAIAGFAIPTQRALIVVMLVNLAYLVGRKTNPFHLVACAAVIVLIIDPLASIENGFWLSFGAVFFLLYCFGFRAGASQKYGSILTAQGAVFVGLSVILVALQLPLSVTSPLANIIAVPAVSLLVVPILFLAALSHILSTGLSEFLLFFSHFVMEKLFLLLEWFAGFDATYYFSVGNTTSVLSLGLLGTIFLLSPRSLQLWLPGLCLIGSMFFYQSEHRRDRITVLDVGQGLSVVIETADHTVVYDVGAQFSPSFDMGSRVVAPYLRYQGVRALDLIVLSHGDNDHAGGLSGLLQTMKANMIATNAEVDKNSACLRGQHWQFEEVSLEVLWPNEADLVHENSNNSSCVILLRKGDFSMLLTGDIEKRVERQLLEDDVLPEAIDVLIAPHHGSQTSSSSAFIERLSPEHVVFSAGYLNRYRHPSKKVVDRYQARDIQLWNTANHGAIVIELGEEDHVRLFSERSAHPKPWY